MSVVFRPIEERDGENVVRWRNNPAVKYNLYGRGTSTLEEHRGWMERQVATGRVKQFIIELDGRPVGSCFLKGIDPAHRSAEFGVFLGEDDARGQGLGTMAARRMAEYGFRELGLHRVWLTAFADNIAGLRAYQRAGFHLEGLERDAFWEAEENRWRDIVRMAMIESEKGQRT